MYPDTDRLRQRAGNAEYFNTTHKIASLCESIPACMLGVFEARLHMIVIAPISSIRTVTCDSCLKIRSVED